MFSKQRRVQKSGTILFFCSVVSIIDTFPSFHLGLDFDRAEENRRGSATTSSPSPKCLSVHGGSRRRAGCSTQCSSMKGCREWSCTEQAYSSSRGWIKKTKELRKCCLPLPRAAGSQVKSVAIPLLVVVGLHTIRTCNNNGKSDSWLMSRSFIHKKDAYK